MKDKIILRLTFISVAFVLFGYGALNVFAETSKAVESVSYIPLIGITSVPYPLSLPKEGGVVTYHYAVKNFLREAPLLHVQVVDDGCSPVVFVEGDDNGDAKLDFSETWRYACIVKLSTTTQSVAKAVGTANNMIATHSAYATVLVGSRVPPPLVSVINITKIASPLSLPAQGGKITFTYKVNNPGLVPLNNVVVADDKCTAMSGKLGDTNDNNLLDINEVWIYTCTMTLNKTTTNTVTVKGFANGLSAVSDATIIVKVELPGFPEVGTVPRFPAQPIASFPLIGISADIRVAVWGVLAAFLAALTLVFFMVKRSKRQSIKRNLNPFKGGKKL